MLSRFGDSIAPITDQSLCTTCISFDDWYSQGEALLQRQEYQRALRCFEEAAILTPSDSQALLHQAVCLVHLEQPEKALEVTEALLSQTPEHSQGWLFHGVALQRLGRYQEAYASYDRALGNSPQGGYWSRLRCRLARYLPS